MVKVLKCLCGALTTGSKLKELLGFATSRQQPKGGYALMQSRSKPIEVRNYEFQSRC